MPDIEKSLWIETTDKSSYPALGSDMEVDVAIVGGGITGLSSAYLLKRAGLSVVVLEKDYIGSGTTGHTTGKATSQHGFIYEELVDRLGEKTARIYAEANQTALIQLEKIIKKERINCGWRRVDNYVFTTDSAKTSSFKSEAKTAAKLGLPATFEKKSPLPFEINAAVKFENQAWLNAEQYIVGLAKLVNSKGSFVHENTRVTGIRDGKPCRLRTKNGTVYAKDVIVATNVPTFPLLARGSYCLLEYPHKSYITAGELGYELPGMYISPDKDNYSILPLIIDKRWKILIGGENHIPGLSGGSNKRYQKLADYAEEKFSIAKITHRWSARDYMAYDNLPLIGKIYPWSRHLYTATAFRKWGMTNATVAAMILRDLITGRTNPWAEVFSSLRVKPIASIPRVIKKTVGG